MHRSVFAADNLLRAMIQVSPLAVVALDRDGNITIWNPAAQRIFGWSEEEVLGKPPPYVPENKQAEFRVLHARRVAGDDASGVELQRQRKDGSPIDVSLWTAPMRDATGDVREVLGCLEDITERKRAEAALTAQVRQLDAARIVSAEITRELNLTVLLTLIHRRAMELVSADGGSLFLWEEAAERLVPQVWHGIPDDLGALPLGLGEGISGQAAERREGLVVNDYRLSPHAHPRFLAETTINAVLAEPLYFHERLVGVIVLNHQVGSRSFTGADQELVRQFASQAAIAIENARLYQYVERQRREIEFVADLSRRLSAILDLDTVLQQVAHGARELTRSDLAQILLRDEQTGNLAFRYGAGSAHTQYQDRSVEPGKGVAGKVLVTCQPFRTDNYAEDPRITKDYLAETLSEGVVAELAVPIQVEAQMEGVLIVDNRSSHAFTERDEKTLQRLADHAAIAIRNARLHGLAVQRARQLDVLNKVALALTTELDPREVARRILEGVQTFFPDAAGRLLEQVEGVETLRVVGSVGLRHPEYRHSSYLRPGEGLAGVVAATHRPVVFEDVAQVQNFVNRAWASGEGFVSGAVFPLLHGDRVIGILSVFLRRRGVFSDDEFQLLQALASHAAIALENARLFKQESVGREQLSKLAQDVVSVQEEERRSLSRELHDNTGQALTALRIGLDLVRDDLPPNAMALRRRLGDAANLVDAITDQVRGLAQTLRPPALETVGLNAALEGFCREYSRRTGVIVLYTGRDLPNLPDDVAIHLYRLVQEALTNVGKYAQVDRARVVLGYEDSVISVAVEDEGVGFNTVNASSAISPSHIGLIGMRERVEQLGGHFEITSLPGHGTRLLARVPWGAAP